SEEDFIVKKLISNGAYGAVYLVRHKDTSQRFALKKINKHNLALRNEVQQVFAERDILTFVENPFVVTMYCSFQTKHHLCMVMEYVEGGDVASLIKNICVLPDEVAQMYFAETVLALEYLHNYGVVHRDLKPDNLLITSMGHIKLTDFGLSKVGLMSRTTNMYESHLDPQQLFNDRQVYGTPEYIAPEVILHLGYGTPVDWWSAGICLYEFLVGCVPFFGQTPDDLFMQAINDDIVWPEGEDSLSDEAINLISCLLDRDALSRLGSRGAFEVKNHPYFTTMDWNNLLRQKAQFVPQIDDEEDTSYFDTRKDRYTHDNDLLDTSQCDDTEQFLQLANFSSSTKRFSQVPTRFLCPSNLFLGGSDPPRILFFPVIPQKTSHSGPTHAPLPPTTAPDTDVCATPIPIDKILDPSLVTPVTKQRTQFSPTSSISSDTNSPDMNAPTIHNQTKAPLMIPNIDDSLPPSPLASPRSIYPPHPSILSNPSSRDSSPGRSFSPVPGSPRPPIVIPRTSRGFGFKIQAIPVFRNNGNTFDVHHIVTQVDEQGAAYEAGLRVGDLLTHVNNEVVQGMVHTSVLQLMYRSNKQISIQAVPLESTSIKVGRR
uniref:non-specific serine/threonine protein kinase n=1 Tax=Ciona savignyi TaxID=51511 RepID=H2Y6L6_CIOSA